MEAGADASAAIMVSVPVREDQIGRIIGARGSGLQRIREECKVQVNVPRVGVGGFRLVEVTGTAAQLSQAQSMIQRILDNPTPAPGAGGVKRKEGGDGPLDPANRMRLAQPQQLPIGLNQFGMVNMNQLGTNWVHPAGMMMQGGGLIQAGHAATWQQQALQQQAIHAFPHLQQARILIDDQKAGLLVGKAGSTLKVSSVRGLPAAVLCENSLRYRAFPIAGHERVLRREAGARASLAFQARGSSRDCACRWCGLTLHIIDYPRWQPQTCVWN